MIITLVVIATKTLVDSILTLKDIFLKKQLSSTNLLSPSPFSNTILKFDSSMIENSNGRQKVGSNCNESKRFSITKYCMKEGNIIGGKKHAA